MHLVARFIIDYRWWLFDNWSNFSNGAVIHFCGVQKDKKQFFLILRLLLYFVWRNKIALLFVASSSKRLSSESIHTHTNTKKISIVHYLVIIIIIIDLLTMIGFWFDFSTIIIFQRTWIFTSLFYFHRLWTEK